MNHRKQMNCARYVGRVGGLAVALGVGLAVANAPAIAHAETSDSSSTSAASDSGSGDSAGDTSSSQHASDKADTDDSGDDGSGSDDSDGDGADETADSEQAEVDEAELGAEIQDDADEAEGSNSPGPVDGEADGGEADGDGTDGDETEPDSPADTADLEEAAGSAEAASPPAVAVGAAAEPAAPAAAEVGDSDASVTSPEPATTSAMVASASVPVDQPAPELAPDPAAPVSTPVMLAMLAAVRDELERNVSRANANAVMGPEIELLADPSPNVLVLGIDGTNLSRVLDDVANTNFFSLIQSGTTAPASIVGHTTLSGPSWSSILTGAWGETTGVINNVFTPWTYDSWPTVFNQLETLNPAIQTTSIADWDVISAIAAAGAASADNVYNIPQVEGDTDWLLTDDAVGDATEAAIAAADPSVPNFIFSYFVGVDENGHLYGGASPQYAAAIQNVDRNLGEILEVVNQWEVDTGEQWTILVVTDHGHQPQLGFGHGFQSPDETATFVIAENPDLFAVGAINLKYQIVDVTPTVMTLFGGPPAPDSDGVSLTTLDDSNVFPINDDEALRGALQDLIAKYGYPDIATNLALNVRTIAATVPYLVFGLTNSLVGGLQDVVDQDIFLISPLAALAIVPVQLVGDLTYVATNVVAQIIARLTGVTGASIFPLWPPEPPEFGTPEESTSDAALDCAGAAVPTVSAACAAISV